MASPPEALPPPRRGSRKRVAPLADDEITGITASKKLKSLVLPKDSLTTHLDMLDKGGKVTKADMKKANKKGKSQGAPVVIVETESGSSGSDDEVEAINATNGEESAEAELSKLIFSYKCDKAHYYSPGRLQKSWISPIYGFFKRDPIISVVNDRRCHEFICSAKPCKGQGSNGNLVRRYLDTRDAKSTGNLRKHAEKCWGKETVDESVGSSTPAVREGIAKQRSMSITLAFEKQGKGKAKYSHRPHNNSEARYVKHRVPCF